MHILNAQRGKETEDNRVDEKRSQDTADRMTIKRINQKDFIKEDVITMCKFQQHRPPKSILLLSIQSINQPLTHPNSTP